MSTRFELRVAGRLPASVGERIRDRFGPVALGTGPCGTVLEGLISDPAAVRALVDLVWDAGGDVRLLRLTTIDVASDHTGDDATAGDAGAEDGP